MIEKNLYKICILLQILYRLFSIISLDKTSSTVNRPISNDQTGYTDNINIGHKHLPDLDEEKPQTNASVWPLSILHPHDKQKEDGRVF
jgi:hypothetical protein